MNEAPRIAAALITLDEERNLRELLPQLDWVDEIVVVDGGSRDATIEVARRHGCRVEVRRFDSFAHQRNYALSQTRAEWVLSLDADERPTAGLAAEIRKRIANERHGTYRVPIRSTIFGRRLRFGGTQDDRPIRLFRRRHAQWRGEVHEIVHTQGSVGSLRHGLAHFTLPDLPSFLRKMNRYTALEVRSRMVRQQPPRSSEVWLAPMAEVARRLVWKQGCLDGPEGWAFCLLSGLSAWVTARRHRRAWQLLHAPGRSAAESSRGLDDRAPRQTSRRTAPISQRHRVKPRPEFVGNITVSS